MDHEAFDRFTRVLGAAGTRRSALGALLGSGLAGAFGLAEAKKNRKGNSKGKARKKSKVAAGVSTEAADCLSPGPSSNMSGCPYQGSDFSGDDLSSSRMVGTNFRNADLIGTDLSSSNLKNANFRGANLACADLSSSQLRNADFRGFAPLGRPTNLTLADLSSSGCAGIDTNAFTIFCGTIDCNGEIRNDNRPQGVDPEDVCCSDDDCNADQACVDNRCVCDLDDVCLDQAPCGTGEFCLTREPVDGGQCFCGDSGDQICEFFAACTPGGGECDPGFECVRSCCDDPICMPACGTALAARRVAPSEEGDRPDPS